MVIRSKNEENQGSCVINEGSWKNVRKHLPQVPQKSVLRGAIFQFFIYPIYLVPVEHLRHLRQMFQKIPSWRIGKKVSGKSAVSAVSDPRMKSELRRSAAAHLHKIHAGGDPG